MPQGVLPSWWMLPTDSIQHSDHQVGPLCFPIKPEAMKISQKFWQALEANANVCYPNQCNPYGKDLEEWVRVCCILQGDEQQSRDANGLLKTKGCNTVHDFSFNAMQAQHVSVTLGQPSSNDQNYAAVCPSSTYLGRYSWTALYGSIF